MTGKLAVLEGIDRVHPSTLAILHRLVQDRELQLFDGRRLLRDDRYQTVMEKTGMNEAQLDQEGVLQIHPAFRILALADTGSHRK